MKCIRLLFIIPLGFLFISCTKPQPIYTSFDTYTAKLDFTPYSSVSNRFLFNEMLGEERKEEGEILKNKHLIDYKQQFLHNNYNIQIKHYKIARVATDKKSGLTITNTSNSASIHIPLSDYDFFNISFDGQYLGVCNKRKLRIFDLNNNLYELEAYKDKKCTEVYFSLDNKYLILNNKRHGQIYDFHNANLVYDNPNRSIAANLILDYVALGKEIILLDEAKRIIVEWAKQETSNRVEVEFIRLVRQDKEGIKVVVCRRPKPSYMPFVSHAPYYFVGNLQELKIMPKQQP